MEIQDLMDARRDLTELLDNITEEQEHHVKMTDSCYEILAAIETAEEKEIDFDATDRQAKILPMYKDTFDFIKAKLRENSIE